MVAPSTNSGRPKLDLASRARNWIWYWTVKGETGLSDDDLDQRYAGINKDVRRRVFFRIRALGSSPDKRYKHSKRASVFQRVHDNDQNQRARRNFESPLWMLLMQPNLGAGEIAGIIDKIVAERGWYRCQIADVGLGRTFLGEDEPAFQLGVGPVYSAMLHHLVVDPDVDSIALLGALFREALAAVHLEYTQAIRSALSIALVRFNSQLGLPSDVGNLLNQLIRDRILGNHWIDENSLDPSQSGNSVAGTFTRKKEIQTFVRRYGNGEYSGRNKLPLDYPIVLRTPRIDWLERNREVLMPVAKEIWDARQTHWHLGDSNPSLNDYGVEMLRYSDELKSLYDPPQRNGQGHLPLADPLIVSIGTLPVPGPPVAEDAEVGVSPRSG